MLRKLIAFLAAIPLGWCIREITKTAISDWVTRHLEDALGIEEAQVIAFGLTYAIPITIAAIIIGIVYWLGFRRGARQTTPTRGDLAHSRPLDNSGLARKRPAPVVSVTTPKTKQETSKSPIANLEKLFATNDGDGLLWLKYLPDVPDRRPFHTMLALLFGYKELYGRDQISKNVMNESLRRSRLKKPMGPEWLLSIASGPLDFYDSDEIYSAGRDSYKYDNHRYIEKGSLSSGGAFKLTDAGYDHARSIVEDLIERA
jgi:hypothetical protein